LLKSCTIAQGVIDCQQFVKRGMAITATVLAALLAWSCAGSVPPVPTVPVRGVDAEVRDAILTARNQAEAQPNNGRASGRLGMMLQAHSLYQPAMLAYERAARLEPKEFAWRYYLALVPQQLSQPEKALDALSAALRIRPDYAPAIQRRGDLLFQLGKFDKSATAVNSLLKHDPSSAMALYSLARVKYALGDMSAAEDLYRRACQAYPSFGAAYYGLAEVDRSLGHDAESAKNRELAKRYSEDRPPANDSALSEVGELSTGVFRRLEEANELAKKGKVEEAARLNEQTLARDPANLSSLLNLLYLARFLKRLDDQADAFYERAERINPRVALVYDYYGVAMVRQGKYDAAATALRKAIELQPDDAGPHKFLGEILERQNRPAEAIEQYRRALAAEPFDRAFQMKLWWTLIINGRGSEVIPQLLPAIQVADSFTSVRMVMLGEAYRTTRDFGKSRQYLEQARNRVRSQGPPDLLPQIEQELKELPPSR
jgi:tetratricopeptide (TPR) repeat protein